MSSRLLLIAGIAAGILAGAALFTAALVLVANDSTAVSASTMAVLVLGTALGWVLDASWLCFAVGRLVKPGDGSEGDDGEGGEGWGRRGPDPGSPRPPSEDPEWWPEFEREFGDHVRGQERAPVAG